MATRYLKTTFVVKGEDPGLEAAFTERKVQMLDITLNVLAAVSLADMEEAGFRNLLREKLVQAYNQAFGKKIAEQIFFTDFVVQ
jgi:flagellar protein FliL